MVRQLVAAILFVFLSTSAVAQADDTKRGVYFSGNLGLSLNFNSDISMPGVFRGDVEYDPGFKLGGAVGYDFGMIRTEGEITYRSNDTDEANLAGIGTGPVSGEVSALALMANAYFDFPVRGPITPYIGVGFGVARVDADFTASGISSLPLIDDSATVPAFQIMAGLEYDFAPNISLTADWRFFNAIDPEFSPGPAFVSGLPDIEGEYLNHSFGIGAIFYF